MLHIALIDDCFPINSRNTKILNSFANHYKDQVKLSVITWDRNDDYNEAIDGYHVFKKRSAYGHKALKLLNLWSYRKFCRQSISHLHPDVIIASHWNNLLIVPKLDPRKQMLIYENLDMPNGFSPLRKAIRFCEHKKMKQVSLTIHASRFFEQFFPASFPQIVLENKPTVKKYEENSAYETHTPIRIAFIGLLRHVDILKNLIDAIRNDERFHLYLHGDGHARKALEEYAKDEQNVTFTGRYKYDDVACLYNQSDVIWAAYPNKDFNVKYAISNKFHESLMFGIPTIYAESTCLGDFVEQKHIGLTVNPYSVESIKSLLQYITNHHDDLGKMSENMIAFHHQQSSWDEDFKYVIEQIDSFFHKKD